MAANLTDRLLESFQGTGEDVRINFRDGSSATGKVVDFDSYTVVLSGTPDLMVYRHSILKLMSKTAADAPAARPERKPSARTTPKPQPRRAPGEQRQPRNRPQPEQKKASADSGFTNPMADKMLEWLKSQKGGA